MTDQNDRQDESLTGQVRDQAEHCPLTGRYFQPCHSRLVVHCHDWEPDKEYVTHGLLLMWKFSMRGWKTAFLPCNTKWHMNCSCLCPIKNAHFKEFWILISQYNNVLSAPWKRYMYHYAKIEPKSKRKAKNRKSNKMVIIAITVIENLINCYTSTKMFTVQKKLVFALTSGYLLRAPDNLTYQ